MDPRVATASSPLGTKCPSLPIWAPMTALKREAWGAPKQWVARAVLPRPPGPFSRLGLLEMCSAWRNPIPHPSVPSVGWQSQSQCHLLQTGASCTPLCRDTTHPPPAHRSLAQVVSSGAITSIVTYSVPKAPPVQNGDPPAPVRHGTSTGTFTPSCVGMRGHPGVRGARCTAAGVMPVTGMQE